MNPNNLSKDKYILLATATWLPGPGKVVGYAMYRYVINVTDTINKTN